MANRCAMKNRKHSKKSRTVTNEDIRYIRSETNVRVGNKAKLCSSCRLYLKRKHDIPEAPQSSEKCNNKKKIKVKVRLL